MSHERGRGHCVLVCTLGGSWPVVPEVVGFLRPDIVDLFAEHPQAERLIRMRDGDPGIGRPDEIWVVTTTGTHPGVEKIAAWWEALGKPLPLRVWASGGAQDLTRAEDCREMTELTLRVCLRASELSGPRLLLSLAGGRKTMSADMQRAGSLFGCAALLHVIDCGRKDLTEPLRDPAIELLTRPLPRDHEDLPLAEAFTPVVVGRGHRVDFLDVDDDGRGTVEASRFPVDLPGPLSAGANEVVIWKPPAGEPRLVKEIERRERDAHRILGNFIDRIGRDEPHENWRSLYRLPAARIRWLRATRLDEAQRGWLDGLPKADLHCHLGGCLDVDAQRGVGEAVWEALTDRERGEAQERARSLLDAARRGEPWPRDWPKILKDEAAGRGVASPVRSAAAAALLVGLDEEQLRQRLFQDVQHRIALRREPGFWAYARPGELAGSAILGTEAGVRAYAEAALRTATSHAVRYLELRGSPDKYLEGNASRFLRIFREALGRSATPDYGDGPCIRFVWILDRRWPVSRIEGGVLEAVRARGEHDGFVVGLDLAGDEKKGDPASIARAFTPAFEACLPLTIHAGEREDHDPANTWAAAYHLHADRIGHGLTLPDNAELAGRLRNRRVCIEVCPTSNREVVGFRDPEVQGTERFDAYPLRAMLDLGLPVAVCTDNPGISRTNPTNELIVASRMTDGGLSLWEALALIRQAFVHAFVPASERERLLKQADRRIFDRLQPGVE